MQQGWIARAVIAAAVVAVYLPSLDHAFQYDDLHSIVENPHLRTLTNLDDFFWRPEMFTVDPKSAMYRPLVLVSYAVNYALGGYRVEGYHCFNIAVHLANSLLLCGLVRRLTGLGLAGLASGLIFALHPIAGEPVNYISSRSESLCALFALASLALYSGTRRRVVSVRYVGSIVAFIGSLLAKSVGMVMPLVLVLRVATTGGSVLRRVLATGKSQLPFWLVGMAYLVGVRQALQTALVDHPVRGLGVQLLTQSKALVYYLKLLLVPVGQSVEHQFTLAKGLGDPPVWAALALLGSLACCLVGVWRRSREVFFWLVWPSIFLLPTFVVPLNVLANEHRLYVPTMGLAVLLGWGLATRLRGRQARIVLVLLVLGYGGLALQRSQVWQTPATLWADALERAPLMPRPHLYMGNVYNSQSRYEDALAAYQRALTVNPKLLSGGDLLSIYNNAGAVYLALGRHQEAIVWYRRALVLDPEYAPARGALEGLQAIAAGTWNPEAEGRYKQAMKLLVVGRFDLAIEELQGSLAVQADPKAYQGLGLAYERSGEFKSAIKAYEALLRLPGVPAGLQQGTRQRIAVLRAAEAELD